MTPDDLDRLPDDWQITTTVRGLREWVETRRTALPEYISTTQASRALGKSRKWWERAAPEIEGAFQEEVGGPWTLPTRSCRAYLSSLAGNDSSEDFKRGPQLRRTA